MIYSEDGAGDFQTKINNYIALMEGENQFEIIDIKYQMVSQKKFTRYEVHSAMILLKKKK